MHIAIYKYNWTSLECFLTAKSPSPSKYFSRPTLNNSTIRLNSLHLWNNAALNSKYIHEFAYRLIYNFVRHKLLLTVSALLVVSVENSPYICKSNTSGLIR